MSEGPIAILGWGSLIWDLENLAPHTQGAWKMGAGPSLPIEFSYISTKRIGALTLVVDEDAGDLCDTCVLRSARVDLEHAAQDLAARERTARRLIGAVGVQETPQSATAQAVQAWCAREGWGGAVWTALVSNFSQKAGGAFSEAAALSYLKALNAESLAEAVRYIEYAPTQTQTPLRRFLSQDPWWRAQAEAISGS